MASATPTLLKITLEDLDGTTGFAVATDLDIKHACKRENEGGKNLTIF